jgi:hypothetical protein
MIRTNQDSRLTLVNLEHKYFICGSVESAKGLGHCLVAVHVLVEFDAGHGCHRLWDGLHDVQDLGGNPDANAIKLFFFVTDTFPAGACTIKLFTVVIFGF